MVMVLQLWVYAYQPFATAPRLIAVSWWLVAGVPGLLAGAPGLPPGCWCLIASGYRQAVDLNSFLRYTRFDAPLPYSPWQAAGAAGTSHKFEIFSLIA